MNYDNYKDLEMDEFTKGLEEQHKNKNIICICDNSIDKDIQFCDVCGLGLPELVIELKESKNEVPNIEYNLLIEPEDKIFIMSDKLSELF